MWVPRLLQQHVQHQSLRHKASLIPWLYNNCVGPRRATASAAQLSEVQEQWHTAAAAHADELGTLRARVLELELAVSEARSAAAGTAEARAAAQVGVTIAVQPHYDHTSERTERAV